MKGLVRDLEIPTAGSVAEARGSQLSAASESLSFAKHVDKRCFDVELRNTYRKKGLILMHLLDVNLNIICSKLRTLAEFEVHDRRFFAILNTLFFTCNRFCELVQKKIH